MIFSLLGLIEIFGIFLINKWIINLFIKKYRRFSYKINELTVIVIIGAAIGMGKTVAKKLAKNN